MMRFVVGAGLLRDRRMRERTHGPSRSGRGTRRSRRRWYDQRDERHRNERDRNERHRHDERDGERDREHDHGRRRDLGCRRLRGSGGAGGSASLPEGNDGIAARHPGDVGIEGDSGGHLRRRLRGRTRRPDLEQRGTPVYQIDRSASRPSAENVYGGSKSLEFTVPAAGQRAEQRGRQGPDARSATSSSSATTRSSSRRSTSSARATTAR